MRTVIVGSVLAVIGAAAGCRASTAHARPFLLLRHRLPLPPRLRPPRTRRRSLRRHAPGRRPRLWCARKARPSSSSRSVSCWGPHIAAGRDAVVVAASGGCNDERGPLVGGAHDPGSFVVLAKLDNEGAKIWTKTFFAPCGAAATDGMAHAIAGVGLIGMATSIWLGT